MKITYIKWLDAAGTSLNEWQDIDTLPDTLIEVQTAGIVFAEDSEKVTVTLNRTPFSFMGDITIPKIGIVTRKDFEVK